MMPTDARIVAQVIREGVPKPGGFYYDGDTWVTDGPKGRCCPVGLLPGTIGCTPTVPYGISANHLTGGDVSLLWQSFRAFISWWDGLDSTEAVAQAASEVWP